MADDNKIRSEIKQLFDEAQKVNASSNVVESEYATKDDVDNFISKLENDNEDTKSQAENIISRFKYGVISEDVAKKRMKNLLNSKLSNLMGILMKFKGVPTNVTVTEEQIQTAIDTVNQKLG